VASFLATNDVFPLRSASKYLSINIKRRSAASSEVRVELQTVSISGRMVYFLDKEAHTSPC
jgi:hypothetical protein